MHLVAQTSLLIRSGNPSQIRTHTPVANPVFGSSSQERTHRPQQSGIKPPTIPLPPGPHPHNEITTEATWHPTGISPMYKKIIRYANEAIWLKWVVHNQRSYYHVNVLVFAEHMSISNNKSVISCRASCCSLTYHFFSIIWRLLRN